MVVCSLKYFDLKWKIKKTFFTKGLFFHKTSQNSSQNTLKKSGLNFVLKAIKSTHKNHHKIAINLRGILKVKSF